MGLISELSNALFQSGRAGKASGSIYDFSLPDIRGKQVDFSTLKGKSLLIVNTASKCGFTPQYAALEELHRKYSDRVFVLGFPANNFLWQEPGTDDQIENFCQVNYGVSFPMFSKVSVKGKDIHPLFKWLGAKSGKLPTWNFCKYTVSADGTKVTFFPSKVVPGDSSILKALDINP